MMGHLIFVGLGLSRPEDMSMKALVALRGCDEVFAEFYTSRLIDACQAELEEFIGRKITVLNRKEVEEGTIILKAARQHKVAFMVAGDPMSATTHVDLRLRAAEEGITTELVHGVSIFTAAAAAFGLQPYKFGRAVTIPFPEPGYLPASPYDYILENYSRGLHTLVLLDIREEEDRYMTANEAVRWLLDAEQRLGKGLLNDETIICAGARIGSTGQRLLAGDPQTILGADMGPPLHCLVIPGRLHFMEAHALVSFASAPRDILEED
ncbi:MAG: diphthine synthase [Euryarchaeota archaeon]|nr:diphthine synthase [Euryarchaeota archaeon]